MLRELNENEMMMVSGGTIGDETPPDDFQGQQWEWEWALSDPLVMEQMMGGAGYDGSGSFIVSDGGAPSTDLFSFVEQYHAGTICASCHSVDEVNPFSQYYTTNGGTNDLLTYLGDMYDNYGSHLAHSTQIVIGNDD